MRLFNKKLPCDPLASFLSKSVIFFQVCNNYVNALITTEGSHWVLNGAFLHQEIKDTPSNPSDPYVAARYTVKPCKLLQNKSTLIPTRDNEMDFLSIQYWYTILLQRINMVGQTILYQNIGLKINYWQSSALSVIPRSDIFRIPGHGVVCLVSCPSQRVTGYGKDSGGLGVFTLSELQSIVMVLSFKSINLIIRLS